MSQAQRKPISEMTNGEFFTSFCFWDFSDIRTITRMTDAMLRKKGMQNRPLWEREAVFESWLREPFDELAWAQAKVRIAQTTFDA